MSPVEAAIATVSRAFGYYYHPSAMPRLARGHYRRELLAWIFLPLMMGAVEGGVVSVIAKNAFAGQVSERWLNIAVGLLAGAPAFANVTSFLWASLSHGRNKIRFLVALQLAAAALVAAIAFAPTSPGGLVVLTLGAVAARICWAGVVTLRATVWRRDYPRHVRASMTGRLAAVQALMLASVGLAFGLAMRANDQSYHLLYPIAAAGGVVGAAMYGRLRMRGHAALLSSERRDLGGAAPTVTPIQVWRVLRDDAEYQRYMIAMFVFGTGNLMMSAPLVIMLRDVFGYGYLGGILIVATIPVMLMPITIPFWSRLLDAVHIIRFRAIHAWAFVATNAVILLAAAAGWPGLFWASAALEGVAFGGGALAWNLGHLDYAPAPQAGQYMGVHVTLTGIRGLLAPFGAVLIYEALEGASPGAGPWVFAICLAFNVIGAVGFWMLARRHARRET